MVINRYFDAATLLLGDGCFMFKAADKFMIKAFPTLSLGERPHVSVSTDAVFRPKVEKGFSS